MARKQAYKALVAGLTEDQRQALDALLSVTDAKGRTAMAWLREWSEAPTQKNLGTLIERLSHVRILDVGADREQRIHRARCMAIARETASPGIRAQPRRRSGHRLEHRLSQPGRRRTASARADLSDELLAHIAPLGWEHINFNDDHIWPTEPIHGGFRPLRNPNASILDAA